MPLIKVQTSITPPRDTTINELLKVLSASLSNYLNKPEAYVMTSFEAGIPMTFAGTNEPTCYIEIKNVGAISPEKTKAMSKDFCEQIHVSLGVETNRIYIQFEESKGSMWGWNGSTFG